MSSEHLKKKQKPRIVTVCGLRPMDPASLPGTLPEQRTVFLKGKKGSHCQQVLNNKDREKKKKAKKRKRLN